MEAPVEMQRYKSIIVSSAVALALTAANLSAQQGPAVPGSGSGGGGDASAANQAAQIALETKIATGTVGIATGIHSMAAVQPHIATSTVAIATGMNALVQILQYTDGLEGLVTSGNALLSPIATSAVAIATSNHAMAAVHAAIATSVVKMAAAGVGTDTELPTAVAAGDLLNLPTAPFVLSANMCYDENNNKMSLCRGAATSSGSTNAFTARVIEANDSPVATAAVETASRQAQIATSVVSISDRFPDRVIGCTNQAVIATTATNYRQVIPAGTGQIIYVCSELWTVTQAALISFGYGGGTNCEIGPVDLTGEMSIAASSGASRGSGLGMLYQIPAGKAFCVRIATASGGAAIGGTVGYVRR